VAQRQDRERRKATGRSGVYQGYTFVRVYEPAGGRGRERRRRTRTIGGSGGGGTKTPPLRVSSVSKRSINRVSIATTAASISLPGSCLLPSPIVLVLVVVLVLRLWFEACHRDKTVNAGRQPGAEACTGDTHLFAFMDLPRGRGRERLGKRRTGTKTHEGAGKQCSIGFQPVPNRSLHASALGFRQRIRVVLGGIARCVVNTGWKPMLPYSLVSSTWAR
jgi:hypothetical protein